MVEQILEIGIIGLGIISVLVSYYFGSNPKPIQKVLEGKRDIYDILEELKDDLGACRISIMYTENGGGIPRVRNSLYSSIEYELACDEVPLVSNAWSKRKVDRDYIVNMYAMLSKGHVEIDASSLKGDRSILAEYSQELGTKFIFMIPISETFNRPVKRKIKEFIFPQKKFYYMTIEWNTPVFRGTTALNRGRIYGDVKKIKYLLGV